MHDNPTALTIRPPTAADLDGVVELIVAYDQAIGGTPDAANERRVVLGDWEGEDMNLATDAWVAVLPDGRIVGYEVVFDLRSPEAVSCDGYVHPAERGRGIGTRLIELAVGRVRQAAALRPEQQAVRLRANTYSGDAAAHEVLRAAGFAAVRHHWHMQITLDAPPALPPLPDGLRIAELRPGADEHAVYTVVEEAFADHWGHARSTFDAWRRELIARDDFDPSLWVLAWEGEELAGAALGYQRAEQGWVRNLGVRRPWRRRGVGQALLQHAFARFYARGTTTVGLGVDAASPTGATRLYERAGMRPIHHFDTYELDVRPAPA